MTRARSAGAALLLAALAVPDAASTTAVRADARQGRAAPPGPAAHDPSPARLARWRRAAPALVTLVVALAVAAPAHATEVTAAELRQLAADAADDPAVLADLRAVDVVDGRPADIAGALRAARGEELEERLAQLASTPDAVGGGRDAAADARDVLAEGRFQESGGSGPVRRVLEWIGDRLPSFDLDWLDDLLPGGRSVVWIVLAAVLAVVAAVIARVFLTSRVRAGASAVRLEAAARDEDPQALDRRADAAEAAGDFEAALRLRFRAGLLRLDQRGAIDFRASLSTAEVRRTLDSDGFDALAATFDDIVYGGREASPEDLAEARETWPLIIKDNLNRLAV